MALIRLGVDCNSKKEFPDDINWTVIGALAEQHGLMSVVIDGVERLSEYQRPSKELIFHWIVNKLQDESIIANQNRSAIQMARLFHNHKIRTYVLKGQVIAECYPRGSQRRSADMDCFLLPDESGDFDAWSEGNRIMSNAGYNVDTCFYKNSTIYLPGLTVENHQFFTPFRGNRLLKNLEIMLQSLLREDKGKDLFVDTWLYRPPVLVTALFMIEHAYSHFLHEGLTWRHVLDWVLFCKRHKSEINWIKFNSFIDEYRFRKFYDSFQKMGHVLMGDFSSDDLSKIEKMMLNDVWDNLDLHETHHGVKGKLALAGNTWRARWKYHYFSELSMLHALWIQAKGFLFIKHPHL